MRSQHVVSRAVLRGFAAPGHGGKGWELVPFDVRHDRHLRARGLRGCGKVDNFVGAASTSAEALWKAVEDRIPEMVAAARSGRLFESRSNMSAAQSCLALHFVRSHRFMQIHDEAVTEAARQVRRNTVHERRELLEAEFSRRFGGLLPGGDEGLRTVMDPYIEKWLSLADRGVIARESLESMFERIQDAVSQWAIQVWHAAPSEEFLIGDVPCVTVRYVDGDTKVVPNIALGDASTLLMPIARDCVISVAMEQSEDVMDPQAVRTMNELQLLSAREFVYYRPGSQLGPWLSRTRPSAG
ncbi:DUF4238 domain-containing protein [Kineosporia sp. A_224]|uniref:DUF4238 domain-containing protein n=1 Tax=Kineosporia sp. A_224 TaxID=1962180 RepID=UPI001E44A79E|nr:DUF4238 domain-containing protein [Kineosporia sp. A_224]